MVRMKTILFVVNSGKAGADSLAEDLSRQARQNGCETESVNHFPLEEERLEGVDLCIVVGGDGTLLGVVGAASRWHVPVIGVNLGRLGFMASFSPQTIKETFSRFLEGTFSSRTLSVLCCTGPDGQRAHALNDIVIKARTSHLIRLAVHCEEEHMNTYHADGLIFATPTGSTAYNLSAGGPIVHPSAGVMVVTPINPHTLSTRAIVLDDSHILRITLMGDAGDVQIASDGRERFGRIPDFPIEVQIQPERSFKLVQPESYSHYYVLRNKLKWTGDAIFSAS